MKYADDFDDVAAGFVEDQSPVADSEAVARRIIVLKLLDVAGIRFEKSERPFSNRRAVSWSIARKSARASSDQISFFT